MRLHGQADDQAPEHGGDLADAAARFPHAPRPFVDLSTGINPHAYPLPPLPAAAWQALPDRAALDALRAAAAVAYRAPSLAHVAVAPGSQSLLRHVAALVAPGRAHILGPTYGEYAFAARRAGHTVAEVDSLDGLAAADCAVLANPNNPDGRIVARGDILALAEQLARRDAILIVDEAFMDVGPDGASMAGDTHRPNLIVLRSFGKFYGLAGLRLGFALAAPPLAAALARALGPWAVSGPALVVGHAALADSAWRAAMRSRLAEDAAALDVVLQDGGLPPSGGTTLFRFVKTPHAAAVHAWLGQRGILVRNWSERPHDLRIGLPGSSVSTRRLHEAMTRWRRS